MYDRDPAIVATERKQTMRLPGPCEVFIDLDSAEARQRCEALVLQYRKEQEISWRAAPELMRVEFTPSRTPGHFHGVALFSRPLGAYERIALEVSLGSDPKRGIYAVLRVGSGEDPALAAVLFE